ncbi:hypothetical protein HB4184_01240 [Pseudomonas putida]|nr:hypothetical protein HB4184_01240 [Pseudomonas putida]
MEMLIQPIWAALYTWLNTTTASITQTFRRFRKASAKVSHAITKFRFPSFQAVKKDLYSKRVSFSSKLRLSSQAATLH